MASIVSRSFPIAAALSLLLAMSPASRAADEAPPPPAREGGTSRLEGTARIGRRTPAVGATVSVRPEGGATPIRLTTTDEKGRFRFDGLSDGAYRADFRRDGLAPVVKSGIEVRFPFRTVIEITMQAGGAPAGGGAPAPPAGVGSHTLRGVVSILGAGPAPEARVRLLRTDGSHDPRFALTGPDGSFAIDGLPGGPWRIEILGAGYLPIRTDLEIAGDVAVEARLVGQPADYLPPPLDLLPQERPVPPPGW